MHQQPKCTACGGTYVTPSLDVDARGYGLQVSAPLARSGFTNRNVNMNLAARVCASCGFTALYVTPRGLQQLQQKWNEIEWPQPRA